MLSRSARGDEVPDRHRIVEAPLDRPTPASSGSPVNGASFDAPFQPDPPNPNNRTNGNGASHLHNGVEAGRHRASDPPQLAPRRVAIRRGADARHRSTPAQPRVRFSDVLAVGEFRAIYAAQVLSWLGDFAARAAVTALVFRATDSILAAAAAFAITYAPWLLGGHLLVSLAERYPYRTAMITCDVLRMALMAAVAIPGLPLPAVLVLLLASALFSPPFDAARSATMPAVLTGDRYVVGIALNSATSQPVQVAGYLAGSAIAAVNPRIALLINAATFGVSALIIRFGVRRREPALTAENRTHLLRETLDGFRLVFGTPALRKLILMVFGGAAIAIVPEGLGAPWAGQIAGPAHRGLAQGMIMASIPLGMILGALVIGRLVSPEARLRLLDLFAVATPIPLMFAMINPPTAVVVVLGVATGLAFGAFTPVANSAFVQALPPQFRARAFGVVVGGLQLVMGFAVIVTGVIAAQAIPIGAAAGWLGVAGLVLMLSLARPWARSVPDRRTPVPGPATSPGTMEG